MARLIAILVFVIDAIVIIDILRSNKDTEKKMLWIIAVIFLPVLGPVLYYVMGRK
jgi:succinate dehydrogenase/fumarate reductase cytochrome b subunit